MYIKYKKHTVISVILLAIGLIIFSLVNSTYALFSSESYGSNTNAYSTGMLSIEASSKSENISLSDALPISDEEGLKTNPYVFTIKNVGNLDYLFDVKLLSTGDSSTTFSSQYIKLQIDDGEVVTLSGLSDGKIKSNITLHAGESIDVSVRIWLSIDTPNSEIGKSFNSRIVTDGKAVYTSTNNEYRENAAHYITSLYNKADKTVVTNNEIEYNYATSVSLMSDRLGGTTYNYDLGNIRYYGADPDNYIYFNCSDYYNQSDSTCEKWRIIGVFDGKLKIVRNESIGLIAWNSNNTNDWSNSSLMLHLNNVYSLNEVSSELLSNSTWYIGGSDTTSIYSNEMYQKERNNLITGNSSVKWEGKIALINASDYGYATDFSLCDKTLYYYSDSACYGNDWLNFNSNSSPIWILSPTYYQTGGGGGSPVYFTGGVWHLFSGSVNSYGPSTSINSSNYVNPALFLNNGVEFNSKGDGSSGNPYQIYIEPKTAANYITDLYESADKTVVTHNSIEYNLGQSVSLMNDRLGGTTDNYDAGNIRYYGATPNNYVYFNCSDYDNPSSDTCEKWRIIGVFDGKVKLIRSEILGYFSWDTSISDENGGYGFNDWSQADLMKLLNSGFENENVGGSLYWKSLSGGGMYYNGSNNAYTAGSISGLKNDATRNMIANVVWNLGGGVGGFADLYYSSERSETVYEGNSTTWIGKVALMYPSDFLYATDFVNYTGVAGANNVITIDNNWISNNNLANTSNSEWTLTHVNSSMYGSNYQAFFIYLSPDSNSFSITTGGGGAYVFQPYGVRPTLYLDSNVKIYGGDGSEDYPYLIK